MKANHLSEKLLTLAIAAGGLVLLGSCAVPQVIPPVTAPPIAARPPAPPPPPPAPVANWRDLPIAVGQWSWQMDGARSVARFGVLAAAPLVVLSCDRAAGQILLARTASGNEIPGDHVPMAISTTTGTRAMTSEPAVSEPGWVTAAIRPSDPILDAIAFSRGRFALDMAGLPMLALPSWPEVSRVIEDCR